MSSRPPDVLLSSQSDERLVLLARAGHEPAFVAIVERYRPELEALARRLCSNGHSEDVVQQAFLSAFAALNAGSEVRHLRGWLYRIVRNAANRPTGPLCVPLDGAAASASSVEDVVQQRVLATTALSELSRLPDRQREAMIGTALDGRARADLASSMGLSEGAVRQLVHRARTALRSAVTAITPWPLARWIAEVRPDAPGTAELATGAGAASSGGLAIKLGALLASGTLLTGAAIDLHGAPAHRVGARAAISAHPRPHAPRARSVVVARVAPARRVDVALAHASPAALTASPSRLVAHAGGGTLHPRWRSAHRWAAPGRSDWRDGGGHRAHEGNGASSPGNSGYDGHGRDGGQSKGARQGGGDSGSGSRTGIQFGGEVQMASGSQAFDAAARGSGSGQRSRSGDHVDGSGGDRGGSGFGGHSGGGSGSGDVGGWGSGGDAASRSGGGAGSPGD